MSKSDVTLISIAEAIKKLPVTVNNFDDADRWVGCVVALQQIAAEIKLEVTKDAKPSD